MKSDLADIHQGRNKRAEQRNYSSFVLSFFVFLVIQGDHLQPGERLLMSEEDNLYEAADTRISMTTHGEGAGEQEVLISSDSRRNGQEENWLLGFSDANTSKNRCPDNGAMRLNAPPAWRRNGSSSAVFRETF